MTMTASHMPKSCRVKSGFAPAKICWCVALIQLSLCNYWQYAQTCWKLQ